MRHWFWLAVLLLAGCAANQPAPVIERGTQPRSQPAPSSKPAASPKKVSAGEKDWRPDTYTVKKGDTLYGLGLEFGYDYKEIAAANNIPPPYVIRVGQVLKIKENKSPETPSTEVAVATPIKSDPVVSRPIGEPVAKPLPTGESVIKAEPKATKEPYSEQVMAAPVPKTPEAPSKPAEPSKVAELPKPVVATKAPEIAKPAESPKPEVPVEKSPPAATDDESVDWAWPASGKVLAGFNESAGAKGVDISGSQGQPVLASAPGKVVYSGSGLRGYGKLVIIKHNKTYLSAYAHNSQLLVKEGQEVVKGQKIAEMGSTDTDKVKLHFEIRKLGKPIDPAKLLPEKS